MYRKYKSGYMNNNSIKYNKTTKSKTPNIIEFISTDNSEIIRIKNKKDNNIILTKKHSDKIFKLSNYE